MKKTIKLKRIIFSLAVLFAGSLNYVNMTAAAQDASTENRVKTPAISFAEKTYDFGIIAENGGPVSHSFEFVNTGTAPLVIISATASCGCTRPTYPTQPIQPGKKGTIKVTYLPEGRPGEFDKVVKVRTNVKESKKISLKISGTVKPKNKE